MANKPTTSECENIIVAYGSGAAPINNATVATNALRCGTYLESQAKIAAPPNAEINAIDPPHAIQLEKSHPVREFKSISARESIVAAKAKGTDASTTVPGVLSL
jgi:hypothetical protein